MTSKDREVLRELACALQDAQGNALEICKHLNRGDMSFPALKDILNSHLKQWDENYFHIQKRLKKLYEKE